MALKSSQNDEEKEEKLAEVEEEQPMNGDVKKDSVSSIEDDGTTTAM